MPKGLGEKLSEEEIRYVFLHELTHFKNGDTIIATIGVLVKTIHWFNPFVYIGLKKMNEDCELACDYGVLKSLNKNERLKYGNTIINVIENINGNRQFLTATSMGKNKKEVKGRVRMIAGNKKFRRKSILIGVMIVAMISAIGLTSCSENKRTDKDNIVDNKDNRGLISTPDKIVIHENGESTEVDKKSEDYSRITGIVNERFNIEKIDGAKDVVDDSRMRNIKEDGLGIELIFSDEQKLNINNKDYDKEINYNKLYFQLESESKGTIEGSPIHSFQYGDEKSYKDSSYGGLEYSEELINIIRNLNEGISKKDKSDENLILSKEKDWGVAREKFNSYIEENNYKVQVNSGVSGVIKLPKTFNEIKRGEKVGELIKRSNDLSNKEGYDFTKYLGEEVFFEAMNLENDNGTIGVMVKDEKVIACFMDKDLKSAGLGKFMALME